MKDLVAQFASVQAIKELAEVIETFGSWETSTQGAAYWTCVSEAIDQLIEDLSSLEDKQ